MNQKIKVLAINGSASNDSSNLAILKRLGEIGQPDFDWIIWDDLSLLPHFKPEQTSENTPDKVMEFRDQIAIADGIIICTPEYVFSIPSRLKNALEWCVSTTVFSSKPIGLITASANGEKGHKELKLIMKTLQTNFNEETTLIIQGVKGKVDREGEIEPKTEAELSDFLHAFNVLVRNTLEGVGTTK